MPNLEHTQADSQTADPSDLALLILFGGSPTEHDVSKASGSAIYEAAKNRYGRIELVGITTAGKWVEGSAENTVDNISGAATGNASGNAPAASQALKSVLSLTHKKIKPAKFLAKLKAEHGKNLVVFSALHGPGGEDGTIQSFLDSMQISYVGSGPAACANCINKITAKQILAKNDIAGAPYLAFARKSAADKKNAHKIKFWRKRKGAAESGFLLQLAEGNLLAGEIINEDSQLILKPASLGSSAGITLVNGISELDSAFAAIAHLDTHFLLEPYISGREIECAVLQVPNAGSDAAKPSYIAPLPGEVIPSGPIYSYGEKYETNSAQLKAPAELTEDIASQIRDLAVKSCRVLGVEGLARVDFFYTDSGKILINEINTMPGFTAISMYPRLFQAMGIQLPELLDRLVSLALSRPGADLGV